MKAAEAREIKLGDNIFDGIKQLRDKNLDLGSKMEKQGDLRGAVVANKEARECQMAVNELAKIGSDAKPIRLIVEHVGSRIEPQVIDCSPVREDRLLTEPQKTHALDS